VKLFLLGAVASALWIVLWRGRSEPLRVVVAWRDGSELELRGGTSERRRLVAVAERVLP